MGCHEIDFATLTSPTRTKRFAGIDSTYRYARSKLANILFTRELTRRLKERGIENVYANVYFPGNIPTEAMNTWKELFGVAGNLVKGAFRLIGQSATDGAATAIFLATSPEVERCQMRGKYFIPIAAEGKTSKTAEDMDVARELWEWTDEKVTETLGRDWQGIERRQVPSPRAEEANPNTTVVQNTP
jgi:NAD(P)-dependent dehydrogenase (short-subunit alcohol dehydrogenase family)